MQFVDSKKKSGGPLRVLFVALLVTVFALIAGLWSAYDSYQRFANTVQQNIEIQELRGRIVYLDEVLTMSARMSAATGNLAWEDRYRESEAELTETIHQAMGFAVGVKTTKQTNMANDVLVLIEERAFELVRENRLDEASALLSSEEYVRQKNIYAKGMQELGSELNEVAALAMEIQKNRIFYQFVGGVIVIGLLVVAWFVVLRAFKNWLKARNTLDKIERDLDIAREIQRGLLPQRNPDVPNYEIMGWSRPADQTGGDYFDWMPLPDGRILVAIADVSGHGIGPALIAAVCRAYIRGASLGIDMALASAIERVNELLHLDIPEDRFVTAAVAVLNPDDDELTLVSAGQAPLFFYRAATKDVENWPADDLPLGIAGGMKLNQARTVEFQMGDTLILPTDGFFEWQNDAGEQYGIKRLGEFVQTHAHEPSEQFIAGLHADVISHAKGIDQTDDITVVVIKRKAASPSLSRVV